MIKCVYVAYETDAYHSRGSYKCVGIFSSKRFAINEIVKNHRIKLSDIFSKEEIKSTSERNLKIDAKRIIRKELENNYQTHGYNINYTIEVEEFNTFLL